MRNRRETEKEDRRKINIKHVESYNNWHTLLSTHNMDDIEKEKFKRAVRKINTPQPKGITRDMALKVGVSFAMTLLIIILIIFGLPDASIRHEQVHIALGSMYVCQMWNNHYNYFLKAFPYEILITWTTLKQVYDEPQVIFGTNPDKLNRRQKVVKVLFKNFYIYRALLPDLKPDTIYCKKFINFMKLSKMLNNV